jgi:hypothetical protein
MNLLLTLALALALALVLLPLRGASAHDDLTCHAHPGGGGIMIMGFLHMSTGDWDAAGLSIDALASVNADGTASVSGSARIGTRASTAVYVFGNVPASATCADTDADGASGITRVEFAAREVPAGGTVPVVVTPNGGDVDDGQRHPVTINVGSQSFQGWATWRQN